MSYTFNTSNTYRCNGITHKNTQCKNTSLDPQFKFCKIHKYQISQRAELKSIDIKEIIRNTDLNDSNDMEHSIKLISKLIARYRIELSYK